MPAFDLKFDTRSIRIADRDFRLSVPADPDAVLQNAVDRCDDVAGDPYWGVLWPAAAKTAAMLMSQERSGDSINTLEVGCGIGLTGIAALVSGYHVTFSDVVPEAVSLALQNAAQNGFPNARGLVLDWRNPVRQEFDLIIGSDVLYEVSHHQPLLNVISTMLADDGEVWLGDTGRGNALRFVEKAVDDGWNVSVLDENHRIRNHPVRQKFQMFRFSSKPERHRRVKESRQ